MFGTIRITLGVAAMVAGAVLTGIALPARHASAIPVPCGTIPPPQVMAAGVDPQAEPDFAVPTCTPIRIVRSATPTFSPTAPATDTPEPTVAPTDTPVPPSATATSPTGGAAGAGIQPPNTGAGASSSGLDGATLAAGAVLLAMGAGSLALAARRR